MKPRVEGPIGAHYDPLDHLEVFSQNVQEDVPQPPEHHATEPMHATVHGHPAPSRRHGDVHEP